MKSGPMAISVNGISMKNIVSGAISLNHTPLVHGLVWSMIVHLLQNWNELSTDTKFGERWASTQPYEYSDYNSFDEQSLTFDSYMIPEDDLELGQSRLLEVDNKVVVPAKTHLHTIVTPTDVPHNWAVHSLGVKCDVVPGCLSQTSILVQQEGVCYGQCSEICGTNHAFMHIVLESIDTKDYAS
ncbi:hypothetical protein ACH5RR_013032 [Cinchona calisaya]|uniref:Cytochrome c oxidase polypeptide II n=1 Tax=Cinchona calisaya TaxID=153742 RepID=A0ABD2ZYW5_9GENT